MFQYIIADSLHEVKMIKEFWSKFEKDYPPARISRCVKFTISSRCRYIGYQNFLLSEYSQLFNLDKMPDEAVIVEYTRFPKTLNKFGNLLTYLVVCPEESYEYTKRGLELAGFKNEGDCPF